MKEIYVFGHKKPDTDSVTSAIALANLKNSMGIKSKPMILGEINKETEFVLNYFNVKTPDLLEDVKIQIKDLEYYKDCYIKEETSIYDAYNYMTNKNITGVPVVDKDRLLIGILTIKMIASVLITDDFNKLNTNYNNILEVLNASEVLRFDEYIKGEIITASQDSNTVLNNTEFNSDTILIVGNRNNIIEAAIKARVKLIIVVGNASISDTDLELAKSNKVNIIKTNLDTYKTSKLINLSNFCVSAISTNRNLSFNENDYYDDFKEKCARFGYNNYPVIGKGKKCLGLIRVTDIKEINRKQVILVDHNESRQSVEGLDEAEILEIIDHHKIGTLATTMPINFRNMTVGSTNTIVYSMYSENNVVIPSNIAGLMLSGIISDTLKFTSPTTTEYDKYVAERLATMAMIDIDDFATKMFKAGTSLEGKTLEEIIDGDIKVFDIGDKKIAISQVLTLDSDSILNKKEEYINKINEMKINRSYDLLMLSVTDMIKNGSFIFFDSASEDTVCDAFNLTTVEQGYFFDKCLSRKKQLIPLIINVIK